MSFFKNIKHLPYIKQHGLWLMLGGAIVLSGCSSNQGAQVVVVDQTHSYQKKLVRQTLQTGQYNPTTTGQHQVQQGETLFSIAFRYGWDWRLLAQHNNISVPYTIYPGQTIYFSQKTSSVKTSTKSTTTKTTAKTTPNTSPKTTPTPNTKVSAKVQAVASGWVWPASGTIISRYSASGTLNKGIDIAGQEGSPIVAASAGTVVYAGNNLHGYGELLIIKHNDSYVSAYGHNRRLLVKEGQKVKGGERIADMGSTGTDKVKLHFEIRQNGKPVNPERFLPKQ